MPHAAPSSVAAAAPVGLDESAFGRPTHHGSAPTKGGTRADLARGRVGCAAQPTSWQREFALLALLLLLTLAWDFSGADLRVAAWFGSASGFAARESFWAKTVLHDAVRWVEAAVWLVLGADALRRGAAADGPPRSERRAALVAGLLTLLIVPALKALSATSCPWSLQPFGGSVPWVSHWDWLTRDGGPGRCFPSGHTAGAFALCCWLWLWWPWRQSLGARWRLGCAALLGLGLAASVGQWARGAHFVSHSLWAAWLCALCSWALLRFAPALLRRLSAHAAALPGIRQPSTAMRQPDSR